MILKTLLESIVIVYCGSGSLKQTLLRVTDRIQKKILQLRMIMIMIIIIMGSVIFPWFVQNL